MCKEKRLANKMLQQRQSRQDSLTIKGGKDSRVFASQVRTSLEKHCRRYRFTGRVRTSMLLLLFDHYSCFVESDEESSNHAADPQHERWHNTE